MEEINEDHMTKVDKIEIPLEEWKSYPEFSNYLFSNTERIMKGDKEIKIQINQYERKTTKIFDDNGKPRTINISYICEILFPKKFQNKESRRQI
jgi:hypothetical protein